MKKLGVLVLSHLIFYLVGSFIAWDINPLHWWLFTSSFGRVLFLLFEIYGIGNFLADD